MGQTKDLLRRLAGQNQRANAEMHRAIEGGVPDPWHHELTGYHFKTLGQLLDHGYVTDVNWMGHLVTCSRGLFDVGWDLPLLDHTACHFRGFEAYRGPRRALDQKIVEFFDLVEDAHLVENAGETPSVPAVPWLPALHLFQHQTHHRGQISALLDGLGIENDWAGLIRF